MKNIKDHIHADKDVRKVYYEMVKLSGDIEIGNDFTIFDVAGDRFSKYDKSVMLEADELFLNFTVRGVINGVKCEVVTNSDGMIDGKDKKKGFNIYTKIRGELDALSDLVKGFNSKDWGSGDSFSCAALLPAKKLKDIDADMLSKAQRFFLMAVRHGAIDGVEIDCLADPQCGDEETTFRYYRYDLLLMNSFLQRAYLYEHGERFTLPGALKYKGIWASTRIVRQVEGFLTEEIGNRVIRGCAFSGGERDDNGDVYFNRTLDDVFN